ncbi:unnamed protein product [Calicophoron daubneyi]|uniref:Protein TSSC1 n=1 Tax=Calicophoron daubneyi TaxID=300641 RepID=A0AAV2TW94_CALDB
MSMSLKTFQPSFGAAVQLNVRCLVGLYGSNRDDNLDDTFSALLDQDRGENDILQYALNADDADKVSFLVGSQSLKQNASQITLVTLTESDNIQATHLSKQIFAHPDGEVIGLTALAAQPDWFVSTFSTYSPDQPELRTGARVWKLPANGGSLSESPQTKDTLMVTENFNTYSPTPHSGALDYVTTLPLNNYSGIRKITAHPSTTSADLACVVGPPVNTGSGPTAHITTPTNLATSYLVILQAPSESGCGDYREAASAKLCLPSSDHIFTSYLKTNLGHLCKTLNSTNQVAVTSPPNAVRWSSYQQAGQIAVAFDSGILGWDVRSMQPSFWLEAAHWPCVRDLDFNPHRPNLVVTGGDDGCIRLWDLRYLKSKLRTADPASRMNLKSSNHNLFGTSDGATEPVYSIQSHSHWVWSVRYHPTRDQLLLSAGSDCRVCVYNLSNFSSDAVLDAELAVSGSVLEPSKTEAEQDNFSSAHSDGDDDESVKSNKIRDGLIARLEQHEESVYAAEWSPVDPWYFASVSYDGNLLINQVPEPVKLNILLQSKED